MQQKLGKRLLAALLSFAMILGLAPGMVMAEDVAATHTFNFMRLQWGQWSSEGYHPKQMTEWGWENEVGNYFERETEPFIYYGQSENSTWEFTSSSAAGSKGPVLYGAEGDWGGYILRLAQGGTYQLSTKFTNYNDSPDNHVYLAPAGVSNPRQEQYRLGTARLDNSIANFTVVSKEFGLWDVPAGDYVLIYENTGNGTTKKYSYESAFTLTPATPTADLVLSGTAADGAIEAQSEASISATLNGQPIPLSSLSHLAVDSLNPEVATATLSGDKIIVNGVWEGSTVIRVSATVDGGADTIDIPVTIQMPAGFTRLEMTAKNAPESMILGEDASFTLDPMINRVSISADALDALTVVSENPGVASATLGADGVVAVHALVAGSATIRATAKQGDKTATTKVTITVQETIMHFNFWKAWYGPWSNSAYALETMTDWGKTTKGDPKEIIMSPGNFFGTYHGYMPTDPWIYLGKGGVMTASVTSSITTLGYNFAGDNGAWMAFGVRISKPGVYNFDALVGYHTYGGAMDFYLAPPAAKDPLDAEYYVGRVNTLAPAASWNVDTPLCNVTIPEAGDYTLTLRYAHVGGSTSGSNVAMTGIKLNAIREHQFTLFARNPEPILVGTNVEIPLVARWDGGTVDFTKLSDITVTAEDPAVVDVRAEHTGATAKLVVGGKAPGKTNLKVQAKLDGLATQYSIPVEIAPGNRIFSVALDLENKTLAAGSTAELNASGILYDGSVADLSTMQVYYSSSNPKVAVVDATGKVTARDVGNSTITLYVQQGEIQRSATIDVTVVGYTQIMSAWISNDTTVARGASFALTVAGKLGSGAPLPDTIVTTPVLVSTNPEGCARLVSGKLRAMAYGTAVVKATVKLGDQVYETEPVTFTIKDLSAKPEELVLKAEQTTLSVGEKTSFTAGVYHTDGTYTAYTDGGTMTLQNDNESAVSIANGVITATAAGTANITLICGELTKTLAITVDDQVLTTLGVTLDPTPLYVGKTAKLLLTAATGNGRVIDLKNLTVTSVSNNEAVATVNDGVVTGITPGNAQITVTAKLADTTVIAVLDVTVKADLAQSIQLTAPTSVMKPDSSGIQATVSVVGESGELTPAAVEHLTFESLDPNILAVSPSGLVTPVALGTGTIRASFSFDGENLTATMKFTVKLGKTESTYYTAEKRAAARSNIANYAWAKSAADYNIGMADRYVGKEDRIWSVITSQDLPRSWWATLRYDPDYNKCPYCGVDIGGLTGNYYPWLYDVEGNPWKIQCPSCRRRFPSNDFSTYYQSGLDEHGKWNYELAKQNGSQYLTNDLYPEKDTELGVKGWGVDDGNGYVTGDTYETGSGIWNKKQVYIAYYNNWALWGDYIYQAIRTTGIAYVYTGDPKYGRTAAVLLDRVADLVPELDTGVYQPTMTNNGWFGGIFLGGISDCGHVQMYDKTYDAVYDLMDDPYVLGFVGKHAETYKIETPKATGNELREHMENNMLREFKDAIYAKRVWGNMGMHQAAMATTAVVLDSMPESKEMIDWTLTGGGATIETLINTLDRDGQGTENSPNYNNLWADQFSGVSDVLAGYSAYPTADLYQNPKWIKLIKLNFPLTLSRNHTAQIGDTNGTATTTFNFTTSEFGRALMSSNDPEIAQMIYFLNGNTANGSNGISIFDNVSAVQKKVKELVDQCGEYDFDRSTQMNGWLGFYGLRDGTYFKDLVEEKTVNTQNTYWMYWGSGEWHGHMGLLNLGVEAYGLNIAPDTGYPSNTSGSGQIANWERVTVSHNTVMVNDRQQVETETNTTKTKGQPLHFDDGGRVKVMDARAKNAYGAGTTSEYRRTVVTVEADDNISYGVDFFRVTGGNEHLYVFHALSDEIAETENLNMIRQPMGTYAGPDVKFGPGVIASGFDGLYDVERATMPEGKFAVDFQIKDFRKTLQQSRDLHLRMTQLNDFDVSEVAIASGHPPINNDNPEFMKFMLVRRSGKALDSLFTTVVEPYDRTRYIEKQEQVKVVRIGGGQEVSGDTAKAVKVTLKNGRVDYIVYASNNAVRYRVDDAFDFMGFVGVCSMVDGKAIYHYLHDGTLIDGMRTEAKYTGTVQGFTKELSHKNTITVAFDQSADLSRLQYKTLFVGNDGVDNGAYEIRGATRNANGTVTLDLGDITLIRSMSNGAYTYNIAEGQSFSIPLGTTDDMGPVFDPIEKQVTNVGSVLNVPFHAVSPSGGAVTYTIGESPDGAMIDPETQTFIWSPSGSQVGVHHASIIANYNGLETTVHFQVTVYPETNGGGGSSGPNEETKPISLGGNLYKDAKTGVIFCAGPDKTPETADDLSDVLQGADGKYYIKNADGTYRAAGKDGLLGTEDDLYYKPGADNKIGTKDDELVEEPPQPNPGKFNDLTGYDWAKDAINRLVDKGVIKGTSEDAFSPGRDISRADFAILVVRALGLTAEATGEFTDVKSNDYYYNEVRIAQALGIVQGSNGTFRPGDSITREDMMVMLARALELAKGTSEDLASFSDTNAISDYAVEAVATLVKSGLITGSNGKINPKGNATRAEVAVLLDRLLEKMMPDGTK